MLGRRVAEWRDIQLLSKGLNVNRGKSTVMLGRRVAEWRDIQLLSKGLNVNTGKKVYSNAW